MTDEDSASLLLSDTRYPSVFYNLNYSIAFCVLRSLLFSNLVPSSVSLLPRLPARWICYVQWLLDSSILRLSTPKFPLDGVNGVERECVFIDLSDRYDYTDTHSERPEKPPTNLQGG